MIPAKRLDSCGLRQRLARGGAVALVDVRRKRPYGQGHILLAVNIPLHLLEGELPRLVPGRETELIFCDDGSGLSDEAAQGACDLGYAGLWVLDGGVRAWTAAGGLLFEGENVLGTALAEQVDRTCRIPKVSSDGLLAWRAEGKAPVVLDSRPWESYRRAHIPGAISCPGGDVVRRIGALVPDPTIPVVINCAGRSRSIYGAQSLINAGIANPVWSLDKGTVGWWRAGHDLARGDGPRADDLVSTDSPNRKPVAQRLALTCGAQAIDRATLDQWRREGDRHSLHLLDVRLPEEYATGHVSGALSAPGGQLVECSDDWIGLRGGRVVLLDDDGVRAPMAASWMRQLGYETVAFMADGEVPRHDVTGAPAASRRDQASSNPDDVFYPDYTTLEQELLASERHVLEQVGLPERVERDGLVTFHPYTPH